MNVKKTALVLVSFAVSFAASFYVFSLFGVCNNVEFYFYDGAALLVGILIASFSFYLIKEEQGHRSFHYVGIIVGLTMIGTHLTKLFIGQCV